MKNGHLSKIFPTSIFLLLKKNKKWPPNGEKKRRRKVGLEKKSQSALQAEKKKKAVKKKGLRVGSFLLSLIGNESYAPFASPPSPYTRIHGIVYTTTFDLLVTLPSQSTIPTFPLTTILSLSVTHLPQHTLQRELHATPEITTPPPQPFSSW